MYRIGEGEVTEYIISFLFFELRELLKYLSELQFISMNGASYRFTGLDRLKVIWGG